MRRSTIFALASGALILTASASAQLGTTGQPAPDQRRPGTRAAEDPAMLAKVWAWQAHSTADAAKLDDAGRTALQAAYVATRKEFAPKIEAARQTRRNQGRSFEDARSDRGIGATGGAGGGGRGGRGGAGGTGGAAGGAGESGGQAAGRGRGRAAQAETAVTKTMAEAKAALKARLTPIMNAEQAKMAMNSLGQFDVRYDRMVESIMSLKLDDAKTLAAIAPVRRHTERVAVLASQDPAPQARERMVANQESMRTLRTELEAIIGAEAVQTVQSSLRGRGGRGGDGATGGRGGRGGDGATGGRGGRGGDNATGGRGGRGGAGATGGRGGRGGDGATGGRGGRGGDGGATGTRGGGGTAAIGQPAPNFTLTAANGSKVSLEQYAGKIVVLQWINPECPVCRRVTSSGRVNAMQAELAKLDDEVVHLTINSTAKMDPKVSATYLAAHDLKIPALIDADGTVGKLYAARTTPHMYVIDKAGVLRYQGAIDDDMGGRKGDAATNYVVNAVRMITTGETVTPDATQPYGCSVKYARD
ncbi:MAG: redoxin domain-containing protein [Phycisphaerales bacterium]